MFSRMSAAVALSIAFHIFLIYGFTLAPSTGPGARVTAIHARLMSPQPRPSPQRAKLPQRIAGPEPSPAPTALSEPAARVSAGPATVPLATIAPIESQAPPGRDAPPLNIPDPIHYPAKDLDIYPQAAERIAPAYPEMARDSKVAGSVTLLVSIDEAGRVVGMSVMDATPAGIFEQAAQLALAKAAFYPAQKDGRMVRSRVLIKVEFDPELMGTAQ